MLTQCSICGTVFRIHADQLSAAEGFVECGECETQFNALERLIDEPGTQANGAAGTPPTSSAQPVAPGNGLGVSISASASPAEGPVFVLLDADDPTGEPESGPEQATLHDPTSATDAPVSVASDEHQPVDFAIDPAYTEEQIALDPDPGHQAVDIDPESTPTGPTLSAAEHAVLFTEPGAGDTLELDLVEEGEDLEDVPALLKDQLAALNREKRSRSSITWIWALLGLLLAATLGLQIAWEYRETIFKQVPEARHYALTACARLGCDVSPASEPDTIELRARDVRDHPQYRDALLVNATLINRSDAPRGYPVIQLGLYDHIGNALGVRRFEPREYLDKSIDITVGMPAGKPIFIVLQVAAAGDAAVSFEFTFL